jgi:hypothetical protein
VASRYSIGEPRFQRWVHHREGSEPWRSPIGRAGAARGSGPSPNGSPDLGDAAAPRVVSGDFEPRRQHSPRGRRSTRDRQPNARPGRPRAFPHPGPRHGTVGRHQRNTLRFQAGPRGDAQAAYPVCPRPGFSSAARSQMLNGRSVEVGYLVHSPGELGVIHITGQRAP